MSILPFDPETTSLLISMASVSATETAFLEKDKRIEDLTKETQKLTLDYNQAITQRNAETARADALKIQLDNKQSELDKANLALAQSVAREKALQAQVDKLTAPVPPPPLPPPATPQKITRTFLPKFAGFTIEKGKTSPSTTLYGQVKTALRWGRVQGLDTWRGFFNPQEVEDHRKPTPPLGNLPEYGRSIGYAHWIADTIDRILELIPFDAKDPADTKLKGYMDGLEEMGAEGVMINDANRKTTATQSGITFEQLEGMVKRIRKVAPNMPIFVSLLGSADVALYEALGVWVELQTFGSLGDLSIFLQKKAILCLSLFKSMTASELKARADLTLKTPPKWFFFYADLVTDYDQMPDEEDTVIRDFVAAWKKLAA